MKTEQLLNEIEIIVKENGFASIDEAYNHFYGDNPNDKKNAQGQDMSV